MKVELQSTTKIVNIEIDGVLVPARIWEGTNASGVRVHAFITRICPTMETPLPTHVANEFASQLRECAPPSAEIFCLPVVIVL